MNDQGANALAMQIFGALEAADALAEVCRDALFGPTRDIARRVSMSGFEDARDWVSHAIDRYDAARLGPGVFDPNAAIVKAEWKMLDAGQRTHRLRALLIDILDDAPGDTKAHDALRRAAREATAGRNRVTAEWLALVEARDAKGGGA